MKTKGIRILDKVEHVVSVSISDILLEIKNGGECYWSILYLYGMGNLKNGKSIEDLEHTVNESTNGLIISWENLKDISINFDQIYDIVIIGCKEKSKLKRYEDDQEMYEACDFVIVMFDSSYWEVFSKDQNFVEKLIKKFKDVIPLETDFQKKFKTD